jgi:hypothetical protein
MPGPGEGGGAKVLMEGVFTRRVSLLEKVRRFWPIRRYADMAENMRKLGNADATGTFAGFILIWRCSGKK